MIQAHWKKLSESLFKGLQPYEVLGLNLSGEESLFIRFNHGQIRQLTQVDQYMVEMRLQFEQRTSVLIFNISGQWGADLEKAQACLARCRQEIAALKPDPYFVSLTNNGASESISRQDLPSAEEVAFTISHAHGKIDQAGFYCAGPLYRANCNSLGQNHWFETHTFFYDYSVFTVNSEDIPKAIKGNFSSAQWSAQALIEDIDATQKQIPALQKPEIVLQPGSYRAYIAPSAMDEFIGLLNWRGFDYASVRQGTSALTRFLQPSEKWSKSFNLKENYSLGFAPRFNSLGEVAPLEMNLVGQGHLENWFISSRAAKEYSVTGNAGEGYFRSAEILPGGLEDKNILQNLGEGLWISDLHYLNWSDPKAARVTGMTRYACFWVEGGRFKAPIKDMRFDESLFDLFGKNLVDLTTKSKQKPNTMTYEERAVGGTKLPGVLVSSMSFKM